MFSTSRAIRWIAPWRAQAKWPCLRWRGSIVLAFVALLSAPQPAAAYEFPYNTASCKNDPHGKFYVALGQYVFAMPYAEKDYFVYNSLRPGNIGLKPPDPSDPVGCFGNPLQSWSHAFAYRYHRMMLGKNAPPVEDKEGPELLTLFRIIDNPIPSADDKAWPGEEVELRVGDQGCQHAAVREDMPDGLTACRIKPAAYLDRPQEDWAAHYRARADVYMTPLGKPFIVNCGPELTKSTISSCEIAYTMKPGLGVSYRFQPYRGRNAIPINHIIDFDKSLRAAIEDELVKDYPWPDLSPAGAQAVSKSTR